MNDNEYLKDLLKRADEVKEELRAKNKEHNDAVKKKYADRNEPIPPGFLVD
jgi:hypothetical protein